MVERRSLVEGIKATEEIDPELAKRFIYGDKAAPTRPDGELPSEGSRQARRPNGSPVGRVPLTTRIRADYAAALKRASLERQLAGTHPNTVQEILEEALDPWMRAHGYLP